MRLRRLALTLICCLFTSAAFGQVVNVTSGGINGKVTDSTGGVLPGASVTVTNLENGLVRKVVTEADGTYVVQLLPPGRYKVEASLTGLGSASLPNVEVLLGNSTAADIKVSPQKSEQVTVTATTPIIDTKRTGTAVSVTNDQIENLPIIGRDFRSLAALTPGIVDAFGSRITANGARGLATDYNIDGATSNNDFFGENTGGTRAPFTFSQAAIREFQVVRSQYDAEFGRGVGAQINAITKSGTNNFAGEAFFFRRQRRWAAERSLLLGDCPNGKDSVGIGNCRAIVDSFRAKDSTQPGFAFGGPLKRDKLFFFVNMDGQSQKLPLTITDIRNTTQFLALSATLQQQFLTKLEGFLGHPYDQELNYGQTFNQKTYMGKIDANVGAKYRVSIRDNYTTFENGNNQSTSSQHSNQGTEHDNFNQLVGQVTMLLNNHTINELLVQNTSDGRPVDPASSGTEIALSGVSSGAVFFGQNDFLPNNTTEKKTQIKDSLQFVMNKHTFKVGTDLLFMHIDNLFPRNVNGIFRYNTAQQFVDGTVNSFNQGYGPGGGLTSWTQNTYAFFASDTMRLGSRLTADVGLRYDWQTMPKPAVNAYPQHPEFITNIKEDKNNLAPRLGLALDVFGNGRSVLRGGTGVFYGYMPDILLSNPLTQISGNFNQITITCGAAPIVPCPAFPNLLTPDQFNLLAKLGSDIVTISPDYQAQRAWRSSAQFEQQIAHNYSAGIGFIHSNLSHVQGSRNVNAVKSGVVLGNLPIYDLVSPTRPYTDMGVVRELCSCETASFKSVTLETHRLALGGAKLSWDLSYTWSKSIDEDTNERSTSTMFMSDPFNPVLSQGPSDNDIRHRVVANGTYRLPFGFLVSAIFQWRTGAPYTATTSFTGTNIPGAPNAINGLSQMVSGGNVATWADSSGNLIDLTQATNFSRAQLVDFFNSKGARLVSRNSFRQPNWHNFDLRIAKTFDLPHNTHVQVLGEIFNVMNTLDHLVSTANQVAYRATYNQTTDKYTFASVSSFGLTNSYASSPDPRQYQVAVKFIF